MFIAWSAYNSIRYATLCIGRRCYVAPERLYTLATGVPVPDRDVTEAMDMFSLG